RLFSGDVQANVIRIGLDPVDFIHGNKDHAAARLDDEPIVRLSLVFWGLYTHDITHPHWSTPKFPLRCESVPACLLLVNFGQAQRGLSKHVTPSRWSSYVRIAEPDAVIERLAAFCALRVQLRGDYRGIAPHTH